eukprot:TRINITY_DN441_c0_g1_i1.p1 TRINITY_DN441_c0_g1~~TRINITY_DN441_c0_g1_i1.p1  ORF type:complete len:177 (+),score=21.01 TRINITY_DN441_c0_g1_i1:113-643(+)
MLKLTPGNILPDIFVQTLSGETINLAVPADTNAQKQIVFFYRGQHCPLCVPFLLNINEQVEAFRAIGYHVVVVSGDSEEQVRKYVEDKSFDFTLCYGLTYEQMKVLGLYVSDAWNNETDHPFNEPAMMVVDSESKLALIDVANHPAIRPNLQTLVSALTWLETQMKDYPVRGTYNQ